MFFKQRLLKKLFAADQNLLNAKGVHFLASCRLVEAMEIGECKTFPIPNGCEMVLMDGERPLVNIHGFRHLDLSPINGMHFVFRKIDDLAGPVKYFEVKDGYAFELLREVIPVITFHDVEPKMRMANLGQQTLPLVHPESKW